jgi:hypothetical protein
LVVSDSCDWIVRWQVVTANRPVAALVDELAPVLGVDPVVGVELLVALDPLVAVVPLLEPPPPHPARSAAPTSATARQVDGLWNIGLPLDRGDGQPLSWARAVEGRILQRQAGQDGGSPGTALAFWPGSDDPERRLMIVLPGSCLVACAVVPVRAAFWEPQRLGAPSGSARPRRPPPPRR